MPAASFPMVYPTITPSSQTLSNGTTGQKQTLIDNLNGLLRSIEQNKSWIEAFDTHLTHQSKTVDDLRSDLVEVSENNTSLRDSSSITVDIESLISSNIIEEEKCDVDLNLLNSDDSILQESELFSYLIDRERMILKLQSHLATANNLNHIATHNNINSAEWCPAHKTQQKINLEDHYLKKYWSLSEKNKQLTAIVKELKETEENLKEELSEQHQLTILYSYLYHISNNYNELSVVGHRSYGASPECQQLYTTIFNDIHCKGGHEMSTQTPSFIWVPHWDQGTKEIKKDNSVRQSVSCQTEQQCPPDVRSEPINLATNNSDLSKVVAHFNALQNTLKKQEEKYNHLQTECNRIMQNHEDIVKDRVYAVESYYKDFILKKQRLVPLKVEDTVQQTPNVELSSDGHTSNQEEHPMFSSSTFNTSVSELQSSTDSNLYESRKLDPLDEWDDNKMLQSKLRAIEKNSYGLLNINKKTSVELWSYRE